MLSDIASNCQWIIFIIKGTVVTLQYAVMPVILGLFIGIVLAVMQISKSKILFFLSRTYLSVVRGTPLLLQLGICYFAIPSMLHISMSPFYAGIIALSINSGAYVAEVIRAGINSIDKGQFEAAETLAIPYTLMMRDIILPQTLNNILPAIINEMILMIKESAIIGTIGEMDLLRRAQIVAAQKYTYFTPLIVAAICYYTLVVCLTYATKKLEKRINDKYK
ncbi:putative glutamine transport system permease protein GlnP [Alphaproteobacteria bacterium]